MSYMHFTWFVNSVIVSEKHLISLQNIAVHHYTVFLMTVYYCRAFLSTLHLYSRLAWPILDDDLMSAGRTDLKALGVKLSPVSKLVRDSDRSSSTADALVFNLPEHCLYIGPNPSVSSTLRVHASMPELWCFGISTCNSSTALVMTVWNGRHFKSN